MKSRQSRAGTPPTTPGLAWLPLLILLALCSLGANLPDAPSGLKAIHEDGLNPIFADCNRIRFHWNAVPGAIGYRLYSNNRRLEPDPKATSGDEFPDGSGNFMSKRVDYWLAPGETYSISVSAWNYDNQIPGQPQEGPRSEPISVTVDCASQIYRGARVAAVKAKFADYLGDPPAPPTGTFDSWFQMGFNTWDQWMKESSYGIARIAPTYYGWYILPHNASDYCNSHAVGGDDYWFDCRNKNNRLLMNDLTTIAREHVPAGTADFYLFIVNGMGGNSFCATSETEPFIQFLFQGADLARIGQDEGGYYEHEAGHCMMFLQHIASVNYADGKILGPDPTALAYPDGKLIDGGAGSNGDPTPMGGSTETLPAYSRTFQGWVPLSKIKRAPSSGTYTLDAMNSISAGFKELRIPIGPTAGGFYTLEYRRDVGVDHGIREANGVGLAQDAVYLRFHAPVIERDSSNTIIFNDLFMPVPGILKAIGDRIVDKFNQVAVKLTSWNTAQATLHITTGFA